MDTELIKRLDKAILKCIKYYRSGIYIGLESAKNLLKKKKLVLSNNYEIIDVTIETVGAYGGCIPFHYLNKSQMCNNKFPDKLWGRINKGLDKLSKMLERYSREHKACKKCPLLSMHECFNCWTNQDTMKKVFECFQEGVVDGNLTKGK